MKQVAKKSIFIIIPAIMAIVGMIFFFLFWAGDFRQSKYNNQDVNQFPAGKDIFRIKYDQEIFETALVRVQPAASDMAEKKEVLGGIVPHHDLASGMLAEFFYRLSLERDVKRFIILSPNHKNEGPWAVSSPVDWQTDQGRSSSAKGVFNDLKSSGLIVENEIIYQEYSYQSVIPFIKHYFPEAEILPIIFTTKYNLEDADNLGKVLSRYLADGKTVIISAVDFSHYLPIKEASDKDAVALSYIEKNDYSQIYALDSNYLDSPASIIVLLKAMESLAADHIEILDHKNSTDYIRDHIYSTTGYYSLWFYKK